MRTISEAFAAGETKILNYPASYFRLLATTAPVRVTLLRASASTGEVATDVEAGYYAIPERGFDRIEVYSATAQTVKFAVSSGRGGYDRTIGSVDVLSLPFAKLGATITNAAAVSVGTSETALLAADATRRGVRFFNNGTADVWIGGAGVTTANGCVRLAPGALWVEDEVPGAAWYGVSGTAGQDVRIQTIT